MNKTTPMGRSYSKVEIRETTPEDGELWDGSPRLLAIFRDESGKAIECLRSEYLDPPQEHPFPESWRESVMAQFYLHIKVQPPEGLLKGDHFLFEGATAAKLLEAAKRSASIMFERRESACGEGEA